MEYNNKIEIGSGILDNIYENIKDLVVKSKINVYAYVNIEMLKLYWNIGKVIVGFKNGYEKISYGDSIVNRLEKLSNEFGSGFSSRSLRAMRKFY